LSPLLARAGGRVLMRAQTDACFLLPLDLEGHELGPPVDLAPGELCRSLESAGDGFSLVLSGLDGGSPLSLAFVDADGRLTSRADLPPPGEDRTWWSRTMFEDGSFLSYTKTQDLVTGTYEGWLQSFDAVGAPLGEAVPIGENAVPVEVAPTSEGALAVWMTAASGGLPLRLRPIDRLGRARGETRDVPAEGALYGMTIRSLPDGGALLAWEESHFDAEPMWRLRVQSLSADGSPRGAPSTVRTVGHAEAWDLLVDPSGARALLVTSSDGRDVDAQPLRCAR